MAQEFSIMNEKKAIKFEVSVHGEREVANVEPLSSQ